MEMEKKKLNKLLLISFILGAAYLIYSAVYWTGAAGSGDNAAEQIGAGIATALVMPHLICTVIAVYCSFSSIPCIFHVCHCANGSFIHRVCKNEEIIKTARCYQRRTVYL